MRTRKRKVRNARSRHPRRQFPVAQLLIILGVILLSIWGIHKIVYFRSLRLSDTLFQSYTIPGSLQLRPTFIRIGNTIQLPIVEAGYVKGSWLISPTKANHVAQSANPGTPGNIIIYAHNKPNMFGPLRFLKGGEDVIISTGDGVVRHYTVTKVEEVNTTETELLSPTLTETLTLYTCSGFLDSKRFVVRALPFPVK